MRKLCRLVFFLSALSIG